MKYIKSNFKLTSKKNEHMLSINALMLQFIHIDINLDDDDIVTAYANKIPSRHLFKGHFKTHIDYNYIANINCFRTEINVVRLFTF